jgi:hypothetical protein
MSAAWQPEMDHLRRRVEALENRLPLNIRVDPPGCPACDGVAGTACRCAEPDDTPDGMLYDAWSVIANAPVRGWGFSGSANEQEQEWIDAAMRWRDAWHKTLNPEPVPDDYEPVPQWRVLVDEVKLPRDLHPLAAVLYDLHCLDVFPRAKKSLARIIAVAEREVGDGWQVDPDRTYRDGEMNALWLNDALGLWNKSGNARWKVLGCRAADWLRDLTEDEAS